VALPSNTNSPRRTQLTLKKMREKLDIITVYHETGSYRATARACGTTHRTVKRVVQQHQQGQLPAKRRPRAWQRNMEGSGP